MSSNDDKNILSSAREFIHETVKTQEQREAEKPFAEKIKDKVPENAEDAGAKAGKFVDDFATSFKEKFNERLDEGTERAQQHKQEQEHGQGLIDSAKEKIAKTREMIYDATKSKAEKEQEEFKQKPLPEKLKELPERMKNIEARKAEDGVDPASMMG